MDDININTRFTCGDCGKIFDMLEEEKEYHPGRGNKIKCSQCDSWNYTLNDPARNKEIIKPRKKI